MKSKCVIKRTISYVLAILIAVSPTISIVGAKIVEYDDKSFQELIDSYGEEKIVLKYYDNECMVITPDGKIELLKNTYPKTIIIPKEGEKFDKEKISEIIAPAELAAEFDYYMFYQKSSEDYDIDRIYERLKSLECIDMIKECTNLTITDFGISHCVIKSNLSKSRILEELSEYKILGFSEDSLDNSATVEGTRYCFHPNLIRNNECYEEIKKLLNSDFDVYFEYRVPATFSNNYTNSNENIIYVSQGAGIVTGDINSDGKSDLSDLSEISLAILGDKSFTSEQKIAADVDGDGEMTLADLAKFKQYITKQIESFR